MFTSFKTQDPDNHTMLEATYTRLDQTGECPPPTASPFWSDQYNNKLKGSELYFISFR